MPTKDCDAKGGCLLLGECAVGSLDKRSIHIALAWFCHILLSSTANVCDLCRISEETFWQIRQIWNQHCARFLRTNTALRVVEQRFKFIWDTDINSRPTCVA